MLSSCWWYLPAHSSRRATSGSTPRGDYDDRWSESVLKLIFDASSRAWAAFKRKFWNGTRCFLRGGLADIGRQRACNCRPQHLQKSHIRRRVAISDHRNMCAFDLDDDFVPMGRSGTHYHALCVRRNATSALGSPVTAPSHRPQAFVARSPTA